MDATTLRAWWWQRQGLDGSLAGKTAAEVLDQAGWARSVGGASPYLTLFARAGLRRAAADAAVAALEIHELPSARGCTYVVPAQDFALALTVGQAFGGGEMNVARKLGVTDKDVDKLCEKVLAALAKGPLDPEASEDGGRDGREEPRRGRQEEGPDLDAAPGARAGCSRPGRSGACPPTAASTSSATATRSGSPTRSRKSSAVAGGGVRRAGAALLPLDRARARGRLPVVLGARRQGGEGRHRAARPRAGRGRERACSSVPRTSSLQADEDARQAAVRAGRIASTASACFGATCRACSTRPT